MKYLLVILFSVFTTTLFGQALVPPRSSASTTVQDNRLKIPMSFYPPSGNLPSLNGGLTLSGALYYNNVDSSLYVYDSIHAKFQRLLKLSDTSYIKTIFPAIAWGNIVGNINLQTDLQTEFGTKQNVIPLGTIAQYFRGDLSLATFPTNVSSFTNDAGYLTITTGDARYPQLSGSYVNPSWITSLAYSKITGVPSFTPTTRILTINGSAQDLSADRSWNVGTVTSVGITNGFGINAPTGSPIILNGNIGISVDTSISGLYSRYGIDTAKNNIRSVQITKWSYGGDAVSGITNFGTTSNQPLPFITNNIEKARLLSNGAFLLNTTNDDGTGKLQVAGRVNIAAPTGTSFFSQPAGCTACGFAHLVQNTTDSSMAFYMMAPSVPSDRNIVMYIGRGTLNTPAGKTLKIGLLQGAEYGFTMVDGTAMTIGGGMIPITSSSIFLGSAGRFFSGIFANNFTAISGAPSTNGGIFNTNSYNYSSSAIGTRAWTFTNTITNVGANYAGDTLMVLRKFINRGVGNSGRDGMIDLRFIHTSGGNDSLTAINAPEGEVFMGGDTTYHKWGLRIGINAFAATRDTNAIFQAVGPSRYALLPKGTIAQRGYITGTPTAGAIMYQTDGVEGFYMYHSTLGWIRMGTENRSFLQGGNSFGTIAQLGTTDNNPLAILINNSEKGRWTTSGAMSINTTNDLGRKLQVNGSIGVNKDSVDLITNTAPVYVLVQDSTIGKVQRISVSTFTSASVRTTVNTTDATPTTLATIAVPTTTNKAIECEITISGKDVSGNRVIVRKMFRAENPSGTATLLGSLQGTWADYTAVSLTGVNFTATASGGNIIIQVIGIAATNITWEGLQSPLRTFL